MDLAYFSATSSGLIYATEGHAVTTLQSDQAKHRETEGTEKLKTSSNMSEQCLIPQVEHMPEPRALAYLVFYLS